MFKSARIRILVTLCNNQKRHESNLYTKYRVDVIRPPKTHKSTLIWLHGSGQTSSDFRARLSTIATENTKVVIPNAPYRYVESRGLVQSWATVSTLERMGDIPDPKVPEKRMEDEGSLEGSRDAIISLITYEHNILNTVKSGGLEGLAAAFSGALSAPMELTKKAQIFLAGYDTGGALAIYAGLTHPMIKLAGLCSISGYVPNKKHLVKSIPYFQRNQRLLALNGMLDEFVDVNYAEEGYKELKDKAGMGNVFVTIDPSRDNIIEDREWMQLTETVNKTFKGNISASKAQKVTSLRSMISRSTSSKSMGDVNWK
ncbi:lysophospholipase II [Acrasis kona]|uniref:Lysophospholipase II n=1 Tax=Acrasis kona TaxID=1008807 RepID=A0AAW2Z2Q0_9EUKA